MISRRGIVGALAMAACCANSSAIAAEISRPRPLQTRVFLTSDDGPGVGTSTVIDVAERLQAPITLFMIGGNIAVSTQRRALLERARVSRWITIGNHSYSHSLGHYASSYHKPEWTVADFKHANEVLGLSGDAVIGRAPGRNVWRLPGLSADDEGLSRRERHMEDRADDALYAAGFNLYGWDVEWPHNGRGVALRSAAQMVRLIASPLLRSHKIGTVVVLMHDIMMRSHGGADGLAAIIEGVRSQGLTIDSMSDYATAS